MFERCLTANLVTYKNWYNLLDTSIGNFVFDDVSHKRPIEVSNKLYQFLYVTRFAVRQRSNIIQHTYIKIQKCVSDKLPKRLSDFILQFFIRLPFMYHCKKH
jgi:hypothetical protein